MKLYVVRHGQTDWNLKNMLQGDVDIPLNQTGIDQAYETKRALEGLVVDRIVSSPLGRALHTAQIINEDRGLDILIDARLTERSFGEYEGADARSFDWIGMWDHERDLHYDQAENITDFDRRVVSCLEELAARYPDQRVLAVCHGGVIRAMEWYFHGNMTPRELANFVTKNAGVREYELKL